MSGLALLLSLSTIFGSVNAPTIGDPVKSTAHFTAAETTVAHKLGDRDISFRIIQYGQNVNTCCVNLHDNEATAVEAARSVLQEKGGIIIKIENKAQRMVCFKFKGLNYIFDPNRIFSLVGINSTLKANGKINPLAIVEVQKFASHLLQLIPDSATCIIALHNNTDGNFSIKTYVAGGSRQHDASQVYEDNWQDADDIALTTDELIYNKMSSSGYNSILQDNIRVNKDGSLSVYYGELNKRYINIETQFGKTKQYTEMLSKLFYILDEEKKPIVAMASTDSNDD